MFSLIGALPPRFQPNAVWMANLNLINLMRQMETTNGARLFPELSNTTPSLLGRPIYENSVMDGTINASAENLLLAYGQPSQYLVATKLGNSVDLILHLFGSSRRPTGQSGLVLFLRTGGDCLVDNAGASLIAPNEAELPQWPGFTPIGLGPVRLTSKHQQRNRGGAKWNCPPV